MKSVIIQTRPFATISLGALSLITLLCGCSTARLTDFHPDATASTVRIGWEAGMEIALDPFVEPQRTQQFFGINAVANGIRIVFVRVSNNTTNQTFLVEKKNFQFLPARVSSGQNADTETSERYGAAAQHDRDTAVAAHLEYDNAVIGGAINAQEHARIPPTLDRTTPAANVAMGTIGGDAVFGLIELAKLSHATEVERNFVGKEMPDQTLAPGQSMEGFIYYRTVPKDREWSRGATMKISLTETKNHEPISMTIPLSQ
jgi:hypothetical protein